MNVSFKELTSDKIIFWGMTSGVVLLTITLIYILFMYRTLPPLIPIFNQMPWGPERLGSRFEIFLPLEVTVGICTVNILLSGFLYKKMPLIARILCTTSLLICIFTLLFTVRTIQLVI